MSYFYKLSQNYLSFLENGEYSDVIVRVGKENNMEEFAVHSFVLRTQSPYFRNVLSNYEITRNKIILEEKNINPNEFKIILK
ncbi:hypothetical protein C1645_547675 [Glomus cerebriforme]|uniref:BTB domain-containing protein n=1 Tax=Glomus cerebriforme TaxID=658196 RepID=A0A397SA74_9GLOM|nr:hypothetical protein C1645_547675 [Glomus cerebriforme]